MRRGGERLLVDCAEGTQRQLLVSAVGLVELHEVFLTHYHADHYLGLPGMLKTFALRGRETPITIYGPAGLRDLFGSLRRIFGRLTYPYELVELSPGDGLARDGYALETFAVDHGVSAIGYALVEADRPGRFEVETADALGVPNGPERGALQHGEEVTLADGRVVRPNEVLGPPRTGRRLVISGDTAPTALLLVAAAGGATLLVHEATFLEDERERARDTSHSTAVDAASIARDAGVNDARPHTSLEPVLRGAMRHARHVRCSQRPSCRGFRHDRAAVPRARRAATRQGRRSHRRECRSAHGCAGARTRGDGLTIRVAHGIKVAVRPLLPQGARFRRLPLGLGRGLVMEIDFDRNHDSGSASTRSSSARHVRALCVPGTSSFDLGSESGYYAIVFARRSGGRALAVEADATTCERASPERRGECVAVAEDRRPGGTGSHG